MLIRAQRPQFMHSNPLHHGALQTPGSGSPLACSMAGSITGGGGGARERLGKRATGAFDALRTQGTMLGLQAMMGNNVVVESDGSRTKIGPNVVNIYFGDGQLGMGERGQALAIPGMSGRVAHMQRTNNTWVLQLDDDYQRAHSTHFLWTGRDDKHRIAIGPHFGDTGLPATSTLRFLELEAGTSYRLVFANNYAVDVFVPGYLTAAERASSSITVSDIPMVRPLEITDSTPRGVFMAKFTPSGGAPQAGSSFEHGARIFTQGALTVDSPANAAANFTVGHARFKAPTIVEQRSNRSIPKSFGRPFSLSAGTYIVKGQGLDGTLQVEHVAYNDRRFLGSAGFVHSALRLFHTIPDLVDGLDPLTVHLVIDQSRDSRVIDFLLPNDIPPQYDSPVVHVPATYDPRSMSYDLKAVDAFGKSVGGNAGALLRRFKDMHLQHSHAAWYQLLPNRL